MLPSPSLPVNAKPCIRRHGADSELLCGIQRASSQLFTTRTLANVEPRETIAVREHESALQSSPWNLTQVTGATVHLDRQVSRLPRHLGAVQRGGDGDQATMRWRKIAGTAAPLILSQQSVLGDVGGSQPSRYIGDESATTASA
jgi:hypothetical protein